MKKMNLILPAAFSMMFCGILLSCYQPSASGSIEPKTLQTVLIDNFDSEDLSTWEKADWANGNPFDCGWKPDHVAFNTPGYMTLTLDGTSSHGKNYTSGEYRTKSRFGYGYFETRMKAAKGDGLVSSFFTYTGNPWDEIDIEILGKDTTKVQFNYYVNGKGGHEKLVDLGFDAAQDFHTYAFEWKEGTITWFVDGVERHKTSGSVQPTHSMQIMMNLWPGTGVDSWLNSFDGEVPKSAEYDYVKCAVYK